MDPLIQLSQRAVACLFWQWLPGMLPLTLDDDGDWIKRERVFITPGGIRSVPFNAIPDLTDPVTLERILDVVCDAHLEPFMETRSAGDVWVVTDDARRELSRASSERLALVQALEAAG